MLCSVESGRLIQRLAKRVAPRDRWPPGFPLQPRRPSAGARQRVYRLHHERTAQMFFCQSVTAGWMADAERAGEIAPALSLRIKSVSVVDRGVDCGPEIDIDLGNRELVPDALCQ